MNSICHRCGGRKAGAFLPCPGCKYTPKATDRTLAWLFSNEHLNPEELEEASQRLRQGEQPDPSDGLLTSAKDQIRKIAQRQTTDIPLPPASLAGISVMSLLLTPLAGFAIWWGYRAERPTAAAQVLRITWPISVALSCVWLSVVGLRLLG
jgi:hypothetical protein